MKVFKPRLEPPANDLLGNIVPPLDNPFSHPRNGCGLGIERRQARSDQVSIDEPERLGFGWQKVPSEGCFACAIWSCNDDDLFQMT